MYSPVCRSTMAICWKLGWKSQPIIFMAAPFVRVLVFCKIKLTRTSLGAVVVMKSRPRSGRGICSFRQCDRLLASFLVCHHERSEGSAFARNGQLPWLLSFPATPEFSCNCRSEEHT